ncbi:MAG: nicotinate-nucleotide--dimethylbenzimidazole phosphoribosyltransferase [Butyrivibrio sp.]|nr:nicotinate-nucleotide--dimethylbenzimidazole phosphoribosyltransferase [Butyrivibrio sp.]
MNYSLRDVLDGKLKIEYIDTDLEKKINSNWDRVSKPINGFGEFEKLIARIGSVQGLEIPDLEHNKLIVCCGDHGIVEEGVSQTGQEVTRLCAENIGKGLTTAGVMASSLGIDITAVDVGINYPGQIPGTVYKRIKNGTDNFLKKEAMSLDECEKAIQTGMDLASDAALEGCKMILVGEMGIGNTTSAAVMAGYLLDLKADDVTGRGAGLDDKGLIRKKEVVEKALSMYRNLSPVEVMSHFGGLELAAMTGIIIGGGLNHIPIVLDGMLSMISALVAEKTAPGCRNYLIPSHKSKEPVAVRLSEVLGLNPVIDGRMALGEGTGAVMMVSLLKMAEVAYTRALKFGDSGVEQYKRF